MEAFACPGMNPGGTCLSRKFQRRRVCATPAALTRRKSSGNGITSNREGIPRKARPPRQQTRSKCDPRFCGGTYGGILRAGGVESFSPRRGGQIRSSDFDHTRTSKLGNDQLLRTSSDRGPVLAEQHARGRRRAGDRKSVV